jgi:hypothetical protein
MLNRDLDDAVRWGHRAIDLAERFDDRATLAGAHKTVGAALMFTDYARGCDFVLKSLEMARTLDDGGAGVADAYVMLSTASGEVHAFEAAERYLVEGIAHARAHDLDRLAGYMESWQALCDIYRGRWQLAGERANAVVAHEAAGTTNRVVALVALGRLRSRRGDPGALAVLDEALDLALRSNTLQRLAPVAAARAEAAWLEGRSDAVVGEADRVHALAVQKRHPWFSGELAFWRWRGGGDPGALDGCAAPFRLQIEGRWQEAAAAWEAMGCPTSARGPSPTATSRRSARRSRSSTGSAPRRSPSGFAAACAAPASARCRAARSPRREATRPASPRASWRCSSSSRRAAATPRSRRGCRARRAPSSTIWSRSWPSSTSSRASTPSRRRAGSACWPKMGSARR